MWNFYNIIFLAFFFFINNVKLTLQSNSTKFDTTQWKREGQAEAQKNKIKFLPEEADDVEKHATTRNKNKARVSVSQIRYTHTVVVVVVVLLEVVCLWDEQQKPAAP
jgi:hypothetical protein